ncbi:hypothetical protein [Pseudomonas fluorescens]|uniref:hypothetical protein n=1 Tax=Pseudomonas fluorescens TaxID=294 RepID=UPI0012498591|nr:hypothetical protein [Pseudomonas fluorescens]CAG8866720.1 hypothetical protein PS861_01636 [Pseudomonas fluorescens]
MRFFFLMGVLIGTLIMFYALLGVVAYSQEISGLFDPLMISVLKDVVGPVSAGFGGAIAGAYGAYFLQQKNESEKESRVDASALHKSIILFGEMLNELLTTKKYCIFPYKDNEIRFLEIPKISPSPGVQEQLDTRLIDIFIAMNLAEQLTVIKLAASRYKACFENFSNRNQMLDEYRALLNASGFQKDIGVSLDDIASVVYPGRLIAMCSMTEQTLEVLDESIQSLKSATDILADAFESKFKGSGTRGVRMDFSESDLYMAPVPKPYFDVERLKYYFSRR